MPWKEVDPMDERILFLADYLKQRDSIAALSRRYGISRKTAYKWIRRYQAEGEAALLTRSPRPLRTPHKTPYAIECEIVRLRSSMLMTPGPKKIHSLLKQTYPDTPLPSRTTIYNILRRRGLIDSRSRPRRRVPPMAAPFAPVQAPNDLWSADYKGQFRLGSGTTCYPLTVMDHHSRYLLCCRGVPGTTLNEAKQAFTTLFREHGLPQRIRTDNGVPFASGGCAGLSRLSIWWIRLGITPERIARGKPQQNGQHERMHRTLKSAVCQPPCANMDAQQKCFDHFQNEYNRLRPHESLAQQTPSSQYKPSDRAFPERLPPMTYPPYYQICTVRDNGVIYWGNQVIYTSNLLHEQDLGLTQVKDGVWCVFFGQVPLGTFDERDFSADKRGYISLKV